MKDRRERKMTRLCGVCKRLWYRYSDRIRDVFCSVIISVMVSSAVSIVTLLLLSALFPR